MIEKISEDIKYAKFTLEEWDNTHPIHQRRALVSLGIKYKGFIKDYTKEEVSTLIFSFIMSKFAELKEEIKREQN